jgi:tellurite methyltransferase
MAHDPDDSRARWDQYYKAVAGRPPREFLAKTLRRFPGPGVAIDLGCGTGQESVFLLQHDWHVLAIDQHEAAIQTVLDSVPADKAGYLQTRVAAFETLDLPTVDLIWAGLSLPFCPPDEFDNLWRKIGAALRPGGRFAGDFFGPRHAWSNQRAMTFHSKEAILSLCRELQLEYMIEEEGQQQTAMNGMQHWHMFTVSAYKPAS